MNYRINLLIAFCLLLLPSMAGATSGVVSEQLFFLEPDGRHALVYTTSRTDYANYNMWLPNKAGVSKEEYISNFLYIHPKEYTWDTNSRKGYNVLKFPGRSFAGLERVDLDSNLQISEDGIFHFNNWPKRMKTPTGHYGLWNSPDNFEKVAYTWVFPENFEPVRYMANHAGEWVRNHNTITYYGSDVNDIVFDIMYQPSSHATYEALKEGLSGEDVEISQGPEGVNISVAATVLYPSGIADLSDQGKTILNKVAGTLKDRDDMKIIVGGHTDNVPIGPELVSKFPTNWELASIRSVNVIHFLAEKGIREAQLESRSFSFYQPVDSNESEKGRSQNRRIELLIVENIKV
ncbi:OmpA/MotB family protein [Desulfosediminicola sp.]|uniref:OmpA/MotB family protein n=1 Tax=Desulfosediminicola sp. TaxID=2886825 RepID=UPI003AF2D472